MLGRGGFLSLCSFLAFSLGASTLAQAERPRGSYQWVDPEMIDLAEPQNHSSNIIFLNRCAGGCTISSGWEDSRQNKSSIVNGTVNIDEFEHGDAAWDAVVRCVALQYEPFDIEITDIDPGSTAPHFEAIVAGSPSNIGASGIGGVSPFSCGIINNAITYSFANIYSSTQDICETVAQETAHAFGLEHEYLCEDPMTYLSGCGAKTFRDEDAQCGEFSARACDCGGTMQNSYQALIGHFDAGKPTPPTIDILKPAQNSLVQQGFVIEVNATDNIGIKKVAVYVNDVLVSESAFPPFVFNSPANLPDGPATVRVDATDNRDEVGTKSINVTLGPPCTADSCPDGTVCWAGACVSGPGTPGGIGSVCGTNEDCDSGMCGSDGEEMLCAAPCIAGDCPSGFDCVGEEQQAVCWPSDGGGGCTATRERGGATSALGILFATMFVFGLSLRRRRRS